MKLLVFSRKKAKKERHSSCYGGDRSFRNRRASDAMATCWRMFVVADGRWVCPFANGQSITSHFAEWSLVFLWSSIMFFWTVVVTVASINASRSAHVSNQHVCEGHVCVPSLWERRRKHASVQVCSNNGARVRVSLVVSIGRTVLSNCSSLLRSVAIFVAK